jgi:Helix-turn-helix domain of resolvase
MAKDDKQRIGELRDEVKHRDQRIEELRCEIDEQRELIQRLSEYADDYANTIERWKEAFGMEQTEDGKWSWGPFVREAYEWRHNADWHRKEHNALTQKHNDLVARWNRKIAGGQPVGRPLGASETQIKTVLEMRERGTSLRNIAEETGLGLNTVRTIVDKKRDAGRARRSKMLLRRVHANSDIGLETKEYEIERTPEDRQKATKFKRQKRVIDTLPQQAQRVVKDGRALVTEAKGLGRSR